jgi:hypothetical protein
MAHFSHTLSITGRGLAVQSAGLAVRARHGE